MIDNAVLEKCLDIKIDKEIFFDSLSLVDSKKKNSLTFIDQEHFIEKLLGNDNISGVLINSALSKNIDSSKIHIIICDDPRYNFFKLYNYLALINKVIFETRIDSTAKIAPDCSISKNNVIIGQNVIVEPNVTIYSDVYIGDNCILKAGCVLGCDGYELKRTSKGILSVIHDGKLIIKDNVYIGNNSTVYKGFSYRDTIIGEDTKIDNLVYIAHSVHIGKSCFIVGNAMVSGSTTIDDNVWIGPGSTISNQIIISKNSDVSIGSIVTKNVSENEKVSGNFAIKHSKFIKFLKTIS